MNKDRIYFLLNDANEIVEGFINATDAWRALYQADGTRSLIAKPLPMRLDDMSELVAKLDPDFQLPPGQFVGSTFHPTSTMTYRIILTQNTRYYIRFDSEDEFTKWENDSFCLDDCPGEIEGEKSDDSWEVLHD